VDIVSAAGILRDYAVDDRAPVGEVKERAMEQLSIPPELAGRFWLRFGDGRLDDDGSFHEQNVPSGSRLYLETDPPRVG